MIRAVCEWGKQGIDRYRSTAQAFVIVDVLSFSTAVSVALDAGANVIPFPWGDGDAAEEEAARLGAIAAKPKRAAGGQLTLSPSSLRRLSIGTRLVLPLPNGSRLSLETGEIATFCGCLWNFEAIADALRNLCSDGQVAVIPAGERWSDGSLRPAIEDWIAAGAIIAALDCEMSAEADGARRSFLASKNELGTVIRGCLSGQELLDRGFGMDVEIASEVGASRQAPRLIEGVYC